MLTVRELTTEWARTRINFFFYTVIRSSEQSERSRANCGKNIFSHTKTTCFFSTELLSMFCVEVSWQLLLSRSLSLLHKAFGSMCMLPYPSRSYFTVEYDVLVQREEGLTRVSEWNARTRRETIVVGNFIILASDRECWLYMESHVSESPSMIWKEWKGASNIIVSLISHALLTRHGKRLQRARRTRSTRSQQREEIYVLGIGGKWMNSKSPRRSWRRTLFFFFIHTNGNYDSLTVTLMSQVWHEIAVLMQ